MNMISKKDKQRIAFEIQKLLKELNHPELNNDILFTLKVYGDSSFSCDLIKSGDINEN